MQRLPARFWPIIFPGVVALGMAALMSGAITLLNTGLHGDVLGRWGHAFAIAFPLAWVVAILWAPIARKIAARLVVPPQG
jgi:hypothetical protein